MKIIQFLLIILIALSGYPLGLILANVTKEELEAGRRWFKLILFLCILAIIINLIFLRGETLFFLLSIWIFIFLLTFANFIKSKKK